MRSLRGRPAPWRRVMRRLTRPCSVRQAPAPWPRLPGSGSQSGKVRGQNISRIAQWLSTCVARAASWLSPRSGSLNRVRRITSIAVRVISSPMSTSACGAPAGTILVQRLAGGRTHQRGVALHAAGRERRGISNPALALPDSAFAHQHTAARRPVRRPRCRAPSEPGGRPGRPGAARTQRRVEHVVGAFGAQAHEGEVAVGVLQVGDEAQVVGRHAAQQRQPPTRAPTGPAAPACRTSLTAHPPCTMPAPISSAAATSTGAALVAAVGDPQHQRAAGQHAAAEAGQPGLLQAHGGQGRTLAPCPARPVRRPDRSRAGWPGASCRAGSAGGRAARPPAADAPRDGRCAAHPSRSARHRSGRAGRPPTGARCSWRRSLAPDRRPVLNVPDIPWLLRIRAAQGREAAYTAAMATLARALQPTLAALNRAPVSAVVASPRIEPVCAGDRGAQHVWASVATGRSRGSTDHFPASPLCGISWFVAGHSELLRRGLAGGTRQPGPAPAAGVLQRARHPAHRVAQTAPRATA